MKHFLTVFSFVFILLILFSSCDKKTEIIRTNAREVNNHEVLYANSENVKYSKTDKNETQEIYPLRKPNETGKIIVVIFHRFIEYFNPEKDKEGAFTTTLTRFEALLESLYNKGYRLINLNDFLNNNISVPRGFIPIVFTFDDGSEGEFNLVEADKQLEVNNKTAVGIMEEFNKVHPDFGLKGTFYVNLGLDTFEGKGTLSDRLEYLINKGFEIGNHTLTHISLAKIEDEDKIKMELGTNQKLMYELVPGYTFNSFALPYGLSPKIFYSSMIKGEYEGVKYENKGIMKVAWDPMFSPTDKEYDPMNFKRVLSAGLTPSDGDLDWWLRSMTPEDQFISDGNPDAVTVPLDSLSKVDLKKLGGKRLILD